MTNTRLLLSCLGLPLLGTKALVAQGSAALTGTVTDTIGLPAPGALIVIVGTPYQVQADSQGAFRFEQLQEGVIKVRGMMIGFSPAERDSVQLQAGRSSDVELRLRPPQIGPTCTMRIMAQPSR